MTAEAELLNLIAAGETLAVEFKSDSGRGLSDSELVEAAVCLANGPGGVILIGVENDGKVTGLAAKRGPKANPRALEALIANKTVPPLVTQCTIDRVAGVLVARVAVESSRTPVGTAEGLYKRRSWGGDGRPACLPLHAHEILSRLSDLAEIDVSARPVRGLTWDDLDPVEFARVRTMIDTRGDRLLAGLSDVDLIKALGLGKGRETIEEFFVGAVLIFGRSEAIRAHVPTHEVAFQELQGTKVVTNEFFRGPLVQAAEAIALRLEVRRTEQEVDVGPVRVGIPNFSEAATREAFHNALLHRDYARRGTVHVSWKDDGIEIVSPGGFVHGISHASLLSVGARPRNPRLAEALRRIGLVERTGRGIPRMFEGQLLYGRSAPDFTRSTDDEVRVLLAGGEAKAGLTRYLLEMRAKGVRIEAEELLLINRLEQERRLDDTRAGTIVGRSAEVAVGILERLVEAGAVERRGEGSRRSYQLSAAVYGALGDHAAYARTSGFSHLQGEQMVMRLLLSKEQVTRREVAALCQIDSEAARRLLGAMSGRGDIVLHGEKRGAYYTLAPHMARMLRETAPVTKRRPAARKRSK